MNAVSWEYFALKNSILGINIHLYFRVIGSNTEKMELNTEKTILPLKKKNRRSNDINFKVFQCLDLEDFFTVFFRV
jgi:hypothetical protein